MCMRKRTSLAMALLLALLSLAPAWAGATQASAQSGSFTLRFSDPKFSIEWDGETIEQDLLGLSVQLGGVRDASDPDLDNLLLSLMLLAGDDPALSVMLGLKGEQAYALVSGISGVLVMPLERPIAAAESGVAARFGSLLSDAARFQRRIEGIRFTEGAPEPVRFISSGGEYPRHSASLDGDQLRELLDGVDLPGALRCDLSYFTDGAANLRVEGALFGLFDADQIGQADINFEFIAERGPDEERCSLALSDASSGAQYALGYDGTITRADSETHAGTLRLESGDAELAISGELQLRLVVSGSAEGKIPDISALEPVDLSGLSEADRQRLSGELQVLQLSMLGKLMTLPSLASVIAQAISGGGFLGDLPILSAFG